MLPSRHVMQFSCCAESVSRIKVLAIAIFFIVSIFISAGLIGPEKIGFTNWRDRRYTYSGVYWKYADSRYR